MVVTKKCIKKYNTTKSRTPLPTFFGLFGNENSLTKKAYDDEF